MLSIGDFSRMTQLSVKTLRHYHDVGLLTPDHVDAVTGYRYYTRDQLPTAHVVRRLRALEMPVPDVRAVLAAHPDARNALIGAHLARLEAKLAETQSAVRALRAVLDRPAAPALEHRSVPATHSIAIEATVDRDGLVPWWLDAMTELRSAAAVLTTTGPPGTLYGFEIFAADRGPVTAFIPVAEVSDLSGRVSEFIVPAAELVVSSYAGPHDDVDLAYSELGTYATHHEISVEGPLREYYPCFTWDTVDPTQWITELCWPVFRSDREGDR